MAREEDIVDMSENGSHERRVIFRPYSANGPRANIYVCTGCGKQFTRHGDLSELTIRFAEHLCEPIMLEVGDGTQDFITH
jgi:hypothetical protein